MKIREYIDKKITRENLNEVIWVLSYPNILTMIIEHGFGFFEGALVSLKSTGDLSVLSIGFPFVFIITNVAYGLGVGINSITSRLIGEGKWENGQKAIVTMLVISVIFGIMLGLVTILISPKILMYTGAKQALVKTTSQYLLPYALGSFIFCLYSAMISMLKGMGNMKIAAKITIAGILFNALFDIVFLKGFWAFSGIGITGIGWANALSRFIGTIIAAYYIYPKIFCDFKKPQIKRDFSFGLAKQITAVSIPVALSKSVNPMAIMFLNSLLMKFGDVFVAVRGLGSRMDMLFYIPSMILIPATLTLVGKFRGENNIKMIKLVVKKAMTFSLVLTLAITFMLIFWPTLIWDNVTHDPSLVKAGCKYTQIFGLSYPLAAIDIINNAALQGMGYGYPTLIVTLARIWAVSLPLSYVFTMAFKMNVEGVWGAYALGNLVAAFLSTFWLIKSIKRLDLEKPILPKEMCNE